MRPTGTVVVVAGPPGSGKSTIGRTVAAASGAALLDQDTLTNPLMARIAVLSGAGDDLDHPSLRGAVRAARYECLRDTAAEIASLGCSVVVVAPFTSEIVDPQAWREFSAPLAARSVLVVVSIDPAESLRRRRSRASSRDLVMPPDARPAAPQRPGPHVDLIVDGSAPDEVSSAQILSLTTGPR